ncbi:MAG: zinc-binding dehydrogenase [Deltaproteobacteria bacterium]|nr:MAG: zinc-binding dehydrogenase [Deltaproteobacteria bacterium]
MRAMVLRELGGPLRLEDFPVPKIGPNDALLRVRASGAGLTVVIMTANPGIVTSYPRIPGHEVAGEVVEVGPQVENVKKGDRVACHFYLTCKACQFCRSGRETLCRNFGGYLGMAADGGYAEYMAVPALNLCSIPEGVSDLDAAIATDAIATPLHACREEARIGPGDQVLIVGAGGGVGIHAVQMAKLCGGWVLGADVTDDKLELMESAGADEVIDARGEELSRQVLAKTGGRGVDAAIDLVATASTLEVCLRSLAPAGRLVILGNRPQAVFGADPTFRVDPGLMLRKMLEIHGSRYVSMAELMQALELLRQKKIRALVTRTFPLEEAEATHQLLRENKIPGRAALLP